MADAPKTVLVAEDEPNLRRVIKAYLKRTGYDVLEAENAQQAIDYLGKQSVDLVITDLKMGKEDEGGMQVLKAAIARTPSSKPPTPVIVLTAHGTADLAIDAIGQGAYNLISKPCDMEELLQQAGSAIREREDALASLLKGKDDGEQRLPGRYGIIGGAGNMLRVFESIETVADSPSTILLLGESGTGKELVAEALHRNSSRRDAAFITINCTAIPESLLESELFGHEKGAFTGAHIRKLGKFEQADGGTLFLDEIGDLRPDMQVKLLRALQERSFERVGGDKTIDVDVRVISATHRDLPEMVQKNEFREDLFYRLNVVPIQLPPLRDRKSDLPHLLEHFRRKHNHRLEKQVAAVDPTLVEALKRLPWPGNVRQLEAVMERMLNFASSNTLGIRDLPPEIMQSLRSPDANPEVARESTPNVLPPGVSLKNLLKEKKNELERDLIHQALDETGWNVTRTAERLGLSRKGLQMKMKELELRRAADS